MGVLSHSVSQISGFASNAWAYLADWQIDDVLPPSIVDTINWGLSLLPKAIGLRGTPRDQINTNVVFIIFWGLASLPTLGATLVLVLLHVMLLTVGIWRWLPAFNEMWRRVRRHLPFRNDVDVPFWRSE